MLRIARDRTVRIGFWFTFHTFLFITGVSGLIILLARPTGKTALLATVIAVTVLVVLRRHSIWSRRLCVHVSILGGLSAIVLNNHPGYLTVMAIVVLLAQAFSWAANSADKPYAVTGRTNHWGAALEKARALRN